MNTKVCSKCHQEKSITEFHKDKSIKDGLNNQCKLCKKICSRLYYFNNKEKEKLRKKVYNSHTQYKQLVICKQCNKEFEKLNIEIKRSSNHFCCCSCAALYRNLHKISGCRVSKLELYLQEQLLLLYPTLVFSFNRNNIINSELDIYIPLLNLAFEINGIYHYKPIFGIEKLKQTQLRDNKKKLLCKENNIKLYIIDVSIIKNFKEKDALPFLKIIKDLIDKRVGGVGVEPTNVPSL